jgi:hypothetical protein
MLAFREGLTELLKRTKLINGKSLLAVLKIHFQFMRIAKNFLGRGYPLHKPHPLDAFGVSIACAAEGGTLVYRSHRY